MLIERCDSVLDQERLAREIFGKWFKHQNFSTFVRQLNLYGFRKISALQQGLLRMDNEHETIQFAHPQFRRGQPDLLTLIHRKRNPPASAQAEEGAVSLLQASLSQDGNGENKAVDVRSIVEGINAIRRQQQAISAELSALKQSNDALWKEAVEARERHAKHEDTINRILKFLAGLFGRAIQGRHHTDDGKPGHTRRLMIGDGRPNSEDEDYLAWDEARSDAGSRSHTPLSVGEYSRYQSIEQCIKTLLASERFATVETPGASIISPATTVHELQEARPKSPSKRPKPPPSSSRPQHVMAANIAPDMHAPSPVPATIPSTTPMASFAPSGPSALPSPDSSAVWNATLQQLLTSPTHLQQAVQAFANAQPYNIPMDPNASSLGLSAPIPPPPQQQLTYPLPTYPAQAQPSTIPDTFATPLAVAPAPALGSQEAALLRNAEQLNKTYRDAEQINADVDSLQSNIHTLIRDMGLDPTNITFPAVAGNGIPPSSSMGGVQPDGQDFSFDWLNQMAAAQPSDFAYQGDPPGEDFSAFLDIPPFEEHPSIPEVAPPTAAGGRALSMSPSGVKRKIEVVDLPEAPAGDVPSAKKKR